MDNKESIFSFDWDMVFDVIHSFLMILVALFIVLIVLVSFTLLVTLFSFCLC